jgi:hypothetical protein
MNMQDPWEGAEIISTYTRAQAIEDGVLVDLMRPDTVALVKQAGVRYPIAMTVAAFAKAVAPIDGELPPGQDLRGRLWDVLMLLKVAIRANRGPADEVRFSVRVWNGRRAEVVRLKSLCGPGDDLSPCLTVMLSDED